MTGAAQRPRLLLLGAGYSARAFARLVRGEAAVIAGTTRSPDKAAELAAEGIAPLVFDGASIAPTLEDALGEATHLVVSAGPDADGDPLLRALHAPLREAMPALRWTAYLSTVGVYGDHEGRWIDEDAECRPVSRRSSERLAAEGAWRAACDEAKVPLAVLRLSGIYGPGRNALANLAAGRARRIVKPGQVFNRIHVADIAGALRHLGKLEAAGTFNVTDDAPSPPQDVVTYAAALMGAEPPPEIPFDEAELTEMARSFYGEAKRVSNARLRGTGYDLLFPDYRVGLDAMWREGTWRG